MSWQNEWETEDKEREKEWEILLSHLEPYVKKKNNWNSPLPESTILKMISRISTHLASQLRGRVNSVDKLVHLGHQLEKDLEQL